MPSRQDQHVAQESIDVVDSGLLCLKCDYNLTGLTGDRCPECGTDLNWDELRRERERQASGIGIHWEHSRWYLKPVGLIATALQVALLPWVFARQIPARPRLLPALIFMTICMAIGTFVALLETAGLSDMVCWYIGVCCQVVLQTFFFGRLLPPDGTRRPYRFWLVVTCYTSYPLMPEGLLGPPGILPDGSNIWPFSFLLGRESLGPVWLGNPAVLRSILYHLWWAGLAIVAAIRLPRRRRWRVVLLVLAIPVMTCISTYTGCQLTDALF